MRLDVPVDDVVVMAVLEGQEDLPDVVGADGLGVDEPGGGALHDLEAQIRPRHELEHHVEHALGTAFDLAGLGLERRKEENKLIYYIFVLSGVVTICYKMH